MACFGFVTFLPLRPDFSLPRFISCISVSTFLPADGEYLRLDDFFAPYFLPLDFFADEPRVLFFALLPREVDFFLVAFFVAITILLAGSDGTCLRASCMSGSVELSRTAWSTTQSVARLEFEPADRR